MTVKETTSSISRNPHKSCHVATAMDGAGQSIGMTPSGSVYTWGKTNALGQLGRPGNPRTPLPAQFIDPGGKPTDVTAIRAFASGTSDAGHTAIIDSFGKVWLTGCDRWQQLGLGSSAGGAVGYTWKNGALWQERFQRNEFLAKEMRGCGVRDMALGGDHTLLLLSNKQDVIAFGKGGDGQLGLVGKPFVSAPVRSKELSSQKAEIAALCAIRHCSLTLNDTGEILKTTGTCRGMADKFFHALAACRGRSEREGLITRDSNKGD